VREYVLTLLVTAAVTYILTPLVRRGAIKAGAVLAVRDRDVHVVPIPRLGGLAMYAGLAVGLLVAAQMSPLDSVLSGSNMAIGLLLAGGLVVAMGAIDDRWGMNAISKLAGQVAAGVILVASGCELGWLPLPGGGTFSPTSNQALVLTVLVVVATINAVNFIDGLDGLAAGVVAIAAISFFLYYYSLTHTLRLSAEAAPTLASALLAGMCLGFLPHNFFPARIFMGDTGSMLLGLLLAYVPISSITSLDPRTLTGAVNRFPEVLPLLLPTTILVIPYADMLMAVVRRTRAGLSPFAADRKHLHHRLLDIGHSHRLSVLIMYLWAAMFSGLIVWFSTVRTPLFAFAVITLAAVLSLMLMSMPRLRWWQRGRRKDLAPAAAAARPGGPAASAATGPAAAGPAAATSLGGTAAAAGAPVLTREPVDQPGASNWLGSGGSTGARPDDRRAGDLLSAGLPPGGLASDDLLAGGRSRGSGAGRGDGLPSRRPAPPAPGGPVPGGPADGARRSIWEPARPAGPDRDLVTDTGAAGDPGAAADSGRSIWEPARRADRPGPRTPAHGRPGEPAARWPDDPAPAALGAEPAHGFPDSGSGRALPAAGAAAPDELMPDVPPIPPTPPARPAHPTRSIVGTIPPAAPLGAPPPDPLHPDISGPDTLSEDAMSSSGLASDPLAPDLLAPDARTGPLTPGQPDGRPDGQGAEDEDADRFWSPRRPPRAR
jgi:UDP-GlcNAc:undecaprenyl-phosphate/decaprenyl-phosphate GlcNAc-1-phosphate transferase